MTEDEAKTKICFRAATFGASQQLADGPGPHCLGSACMAWRWSTRTYARSGGGFGQTPSTSHGFCGLAGRPA